MELEGKYVAFISWDDWPDPDQNKARSLKLSKIHIGVYRNGRVHSNCTNVHGRYHNDFSDKNSEIFLGRVDAARICKFCLDRNGPFWNKLQKTEAPPKEYYFIFDMTGKTAEVIHSDDPAVILRTLKNLVRFADHLEDINNKDSKVMVIKGSFVELDVKVRRIVEHIKFETKKEK